MTTQPDPQSEPDSPERPLRGPAWARAATEDKDELTDAQKAHDAASISTSD
jgi:hypothetical protein